MTLDLFTHTYPFLFSPDEGGAGGGADGAESADQPQDAGTAAETISKEEHQREVDRYRNQFGQSEKARKELEKRLAALEDAQKSEAERLADKARRADELEPELAAARQRAEAAEAALTAEVDEQKKQLPKEMQDLLPPNLAPAEQLAWIRRALAAAAKLKPAGSLPPAGGRNPGAQDRETITDEQREQRLRQVAARW